MDNEITYPVAQGTQTFFEKAATAGLELRTGQVEMAMEICEAIMKTTPLAVEAEVGIGKSYAYLIPAVMKYRKDHRQIVIATSTIIDYKMSIVKDKIKEVAIPEMIIKLKQGAGRLIRCSDDKGIVSILDPRASNMYRMNILNALSEKNSVETIDELAEFWKRISNE